MKEPKKLSQIAGFALSSMKKEESPRKIHALSTSNQLIENLNLLRQKMRGEKAKSLLMGSSESSIENLKRTVIEGLKQLPEKELSSFVLSKFLQEDFLELLTEAWKEKILQKTPQSLLFEELDFSLESFRALMMALTYVTSLRALKFDTCPLEAKRCKILSTFLRMQRELVSFDVSYSLSDWTSFKEVLTPLIGHPNLTYLSFKGCQLTDDAIVFLLELLKETPLLKNLDISENSFSDERLKELAEAQRGSSCFVYFGRVI